MIEAVINAVRAYLDNLELTRAAEAWFIRYAAWHNALWPDAPMSRYPRRASLLSLEQQHGTWYAVFSAWAPETADSGMAFPLAWVLASDVTWKKDALPLERARHQADTVAAGVKAWLDEHNMVAVPKVPQRGIHLDVVAASPAREEG